MTSIEEKPKRFIFNDTDMKHFLDSTAKSDLLHFVEAMGKACSISSAPLDRSNPLDGVPVSIACLCGALEQMLSWVDDFPPARAEAARFGNPAFREWHGRLTERSNAIVTAILKTRNSHNVHDAFRMGGEAAAGRSSVDPDPLLDHVTCYLHDAFGHAVRLDYGTGHESSFVVFLLVLSRVKCFGETQPSLECLRSITLAVMDSYLKVTRRLQTDYMLEPAGSHGVWGLDDYHCLPFYFGACQLASKQNLPMDLESPTCVNDEHVLADFKDGYLYIGCIAYIRKLKKGVPFFESSSMLYDISQTLPNWDKVARGMLRLYQGEVLEKRQVVQHFVFGKYFQATWTPSQAEPTAPTTTFRSGANPMLPSGDAMQPTRAPWAK